jgi:hypothetical protein
MQQKEKKLIVIIRTPAGPDFYLDTRQMQNSHIFKTVKLFFFGQVIVKEKNYESMNALKNELIN